MKMESKTAVKVLKLMAAGFILTPSLAMADSSALAELKATAGNTAAQATVVAIPQSAPVAGSVAQESASANEASNAIRVSVQNSFEATLTNASSGVVSPDAPASNVLGFDFQQVLSRGGLFFKPSVAAFRVAVGTHVQASSIPSCPAGSLGLFLAVGPKGVTSVTPNNICLTQASLAAPQRINVQVEYLASSNGLFFNHAVKHDVHFELLVQKP